MMGVEEHLKELSAEYFRQAEKRTFRCFAMDVGSCGTGFCGGRRGSMALSRENRPRGGVVGHDGDAD